MPSRIPDGGQRGWIIPIGGAEDKESRRRILRRFVDLCGGADADIVVIPTASRKPDTGSRYEDLFDRLDAGKVTSIAPTATTSNSVNTYAVTASIDKVPTGARLGQTISVPTPRTISSPTSSSDRASMAASMSRGVPAPPRAGSGKGGATSSGASTAAPSSTGP